MRNYITMRELPEMISKGWQVIDVRSPQELSYLKKYPGAINIPYPKIVEQMAVLFPKKDAKLIMLCNAGNRSGLSAKAYQQAGYNQVYVLQGGIESLED